MTTVCKQYHLQENFRTDTKFLESFMASLDYENSITFHISGFLSSKKIWI